MQIRLPKIDLPKFSGLYEDWYEFYDTFNSLIHNSDNISKVEKFHYLKSALHGQPAELLRSLELTENNYDDAWLTLKERFDNKRIIIQKHIKAIYELPSVAKENLAGLRQILDGICKHIRALKALNRPTDSWDDLLIHIISQKIDPTTNKEWETSLAKDSIPTLKNITDFIAHKCQTLEATARTSQISLDKPLIKKTSASFLATNKNKCSFCNGQHPTYFCEQLLKMPIDQRIKDVKSKGLCLNCLRFGHTVKQCNSSTCKKCAKKHNTLLHLQGSSSSTDSSAAVSDQSSTVAYHNYHTCLKSQILLSTAIIEVQDINSKVHHCRALLDTGSQSNFVTESLVNRLGLRRHNVQIPVAGISQSTTQVKHSVDIKIKSRYNAFQSNINCLVLKQITDKLPLHSFKSSFVSIPRNIKLADPKFNISSEIDILIGADLFYNLLCVGQIKISQNQPYLQKTHFGWIVSGRVGANNNVAKQQTALCHFSVNSDIESSLTRFWQLEEYTPQTKYSNEEQACEEHFKQTFRRNSEGRFIVQLPIKLGALQQLGDTRVLAQKRFYSLEKKLNNQPLLKKQYSAFITEYLELGHMKLVSDDQIYPDDKPTCYLPHHAVIKQTSLTTKLRVVFDGSAVSTSGISLNNILMVGPVIQQDLLSIILRFRMHKIVVTADIAKMYRQVLVDDSQVALQRILWRDNNNDKLRTYELSTVTYGTASASFLAIRSLQQLALEEKDRYPIGFKITTNDFYVDDLITGANSESEVQTICNEVNDMLLKGGFELRKWVSNSSNLMNNISLNAMKHSTVHLDKNESVKTLGLQWNSHLDNLRFSIPTYDNSARITKRSILSNVSQIFDPLGLIGPVVVISKMLLQGLWSLKLSWDESVPAHIHSTWFQVSSQLQALNSINIPRRVINSDHPSRTEVHGFCDASEQAYGACIYVRITNERGEHASNLLCAKSRIAPLKSISVPKLELCGAILLARLMRKTIAALNINPEAIHYWTDSSITLAWIQSTARTWKTFVANRVGEIQELTDISNWHHVKTTDNPADIISRGQTPNELKECTLWWHGPAWLSQNECEWPSLNLTQIPHHNVPELRTIMLTAIVVEDDFKIFTRYSKLNKLIRIIAYCLRFVSNIRHKLKNSTENKETEHLTTSELSSAMLRLVKIAQKTSFARELNDLSKQGVVHQKSQILCLNPFIDKDGIIRVGGRLRKSSFSYMQKHQAILSKSHPLTKLIIEREHVKLLHAGVQTTIASLRTAYWPLGIRDTARFIIKKCVKCFKIYPTSIQPLMGDLPAERVTPSRPFSKCGVDFFGPLHLRESKRRNRKTVKTYGAIFICFATKALHLELVTDLSSDAFIAAIKRFISRRGKPTDMYSDNGTNFVGAHRQIRSLQEQFINDIDKKYITSAMAEQNINWHFIPPRTPHFGGIWEAAVKSVKRHMKIVVGNASLTYEEMYTLLTQIEAILNSRPLTMLSNDPNDLSYLTPGHFLIGDSLISTNEPDLMSIPLNRLSRWQHLERLRQHFWSRWSKEYLHQLQERTKWKKTASVSIQVGQLVLIREDNLPPLRWSMGRIEEVHPGKDGIIRVASVRTASGSCKRAVIRLCPVPIDYD